MTRLQIPPVYNNHFCFQSDILALNVSSFATPGSGTRNSIGQGRLSRTGITSGFKFGRSSRPRDEEPEGFVWSSRNGRFAGR